MKKLPTIFACLFASVPDIKAQNIFVQNGDFKDYSQCPNSATQLDYCKGWHQYTQGTSDFFHACSNYWAGVLNNYFGYQQAASGKDYVGGNVW